MKQLTGYNEMLQTMPKSAHIAFSSETELGFLYLLKKGYRHCFVVLEFDEVWCCIDPLSTYCDVQVVLKKHVADLPLWLNFQGHEVLKAPIDRCCLRVRPFGFLSCVSIVKRVLGLRKWWIITPWQLKKYIHSYYKGALENGKSYSKTKSPQNG